MTASPAAPGTAPGGGAQDTATPVERVALALEAERDRWRAAAHAEASDLDQARARTAIGSAWNRAAGKVRDELGPAWDALSAERNNYRQALAEILQMTWHGDQRLKIQARAARELQAPPKPNEDGNHD